jgi:hypothetical protein
LLHVPELQRQGFEREKNLGVATLEPGDHDPVRYHTTWDGKREELRVQGDERAGRYGKPPAVAIVSVVGGSSQVIEVRSSL